MAKDFGVRCRHPGRARRLIARLSVFGEPAALALGRFGVLIQKIANTLRFELFWARHVTADPRTIVVPSFTKSRSKHEIWDLALACARDLGHVGKILEFGTNNGGSLRYFWRNVPESFTLYGFDCFEGIPEEWDSLPKGAIKGYGFPSELWADDLALQKTIAEQVRLTGEFPQPTQPNIRIDKGLFAHSVPRFLCGGVPQDIRLIHFDADIYMGTRPVLDSICGQLGYRYYVLFDELYSVNHEFRAWTEFVENFNVEKWRVVAISEDGVQALFEVNGA
ncbi:MAG: hypothetical protein AMJ84_11580 [Acidithiobacillales bacterium SM23_46]|nr:MAG: hypothetical protein AMJ84_11580 [Acidithiobacillales bacterium SM23_46]